MIRLIRVGKLERALASRKGELLRFLAPGTHWLFGLGWTVRREPVTGVFFAARCGREVEELSRLRGAASDFAFVTLRSHERALVWIGGRLEWVVTGGPWAFWRVLAPVRIEVVDASAALVDDFVPLEAARAANGGSAAFEELRVPQGSMGFLFVDQVRRHRLAPGRHVAWRNVGALRLELVSSARSRLDVLVPEVETRDLSRIRVTLAVHYRVTDAERWVESAPAVLERLREVAATAVRSVAGRRPRARFPGDRVETGLALEAAVAVLAGDLPVEVLEVTLGSVTSVPRLERPRFRGFGERGREVAAAMRDFAARPWVPERRFRRH